MKTCTKCTETKEISEFNKNQYWCRSCSKHVGKLYRERNREKEQERNKRWFLNNKEWARTREANRRASILSVSDGSITEKSITTLLEYYKNCCLSCGIVGVDIQIDHVIPLARGGVHSIRNVQPLCGKCNKQKGTKTIDFR